MEAPDAISLRLRIPNWPGHRAGQHVDARRTVEDGYSTERSYSIASPPGAEPCRLTVVRIDDGEVSPYLTQVVRTGDELELRGPIGGLFVWGTGPNRPTVLVGGGSGVVPLMAMFRHHAVLDHGTPMHVAYSARTRRDVSYHDELPRLVNAHRRLTITLRREGPSHWEEHRGRVGRTLLADAGWRPTGDPSCFVCGPTSFAKAAADALVAMGHPPPNIRTERFGRTGR